MVIDLTSVFAYGIGIAAFCWAAKKLIDVLIPINHLVERNKQFLRDNPAPPQPNTPIDYQVAAAMMLSTAIEVGDLPESRSTCSSIFGDDEGYGETHL